MRFISHRGNIDKPECKNYENSVFGIQLALNKGFDVEIDLWKVGCQIYLGHDFPTVDVGFSFLCENIDKLLVHAKNLEALEYMLEHGFHCFWHQEDNFALTSKGYIVSYPGYTIGRNTICMKPELQSLETLTEYPPYALCSDYIQQYRECFECL